MIVSINPVQLPFAAELEFPLGLAKGEVLTLVVGEGNINDFPKANDIRVDPVTRIVHIGLKAEKNAEEQKEVEDQQQVKTKQKDLKKIFCKDCPLAFTSASDVSLHKVLCARTNLRSVHMEVNGKSFELSLNCKQSSDKQVELVVSSDRHSATIVRQISEPYRIIVSCWNTVPQSFYEDCIQVASKMLTRHMPPTEEGTTIRSRITVMSNRVKTTSLEIEGIEPSTEKNSLQFSDIYSDFENFLVSLEAVKDCTTAIVNGVGEEIESRRETAASKMELRHRTRKRKKDQIEEDAMVVETTTIQSSESQVAIEDTSEQAIQDEADDKIYCLICLKINRKLRFMNTHALEIHMNNNHSVEVLEAPECGKCSKKFVSADALSNHEKKCNPKFPKKCQVCNKSFAMGLHRDRHLREVHGIIKEHSCGICGQKYQSEKHRDWHLVTKHKDSLTLEELERLGMEEIQCTLCEFRSYSSKGMQVHRQKEHIENEKAFRCPACGVGNDSLAGIQAHITEKHGPDDRWWICQFCNRTFHRENTDVIELHLEQHNRNTGLVCVHCNKVFETETVMLDHVNRNHDKNTMPYICDICDQGSESYKELLKHMLKHNPFKTSLYRLQRQHIVKRNIEEGVMFKKETRQQTNQIYGCDVCNKQFDLEATLMAHRIVFHNDPGKEFYRCPVCNKAFKPHHLSYHLRLHSGERPHKCQYCDATFHTVASCSDHEIVKHTFAYKLRCPLCNKGFVSRAKTWQHIVRFHKETPEQADKILPPVTHKVLSILQKRRQTEEIKQLIENSSEIDGSPGGSKRNTSEQFRVRRQDKDRDLDDHELDNHDVDDDGENDDDDDDNNRDCGAAADDDNDEHEVMTSTEVEIASGQLEVADGSVVDIKSFEDAEAVEINDIPQGVSVDYPQPEVGLHYYRLVYADGSQTTVPIAPGEHVVIEDEHGNQQIIEPSEQPD